MATPSTHASANEMIVIHTSIQAPTRNACLWSRTGCQLIWYAISISGLRGGRGRRSRARLTPTGSGQVRDLRAVRADERRRQVVLLGRGPDPLLPAARH